MSTVLVDLLAKQTPGRLNSMRAEIREQMNRLQLEYEMIGRALAAQGQPSGSRSGQETPRQGAARPSSDRRAIFREIMSTQATWTTAEIVTALDGRGIRSNDSAARAMLRRMAQAGEAEHVPGSKRWRLTSANGSRRESPAEATNSGPEGYVRANALAPVDGLR